jgi:hypothetical protein
MFVELAPCPGPVVRMHECSPTQSMMFAIARIDAVMLAPTGQPPDAVVGDVPFICAEFRRPNGGLEEHVLVFFFSKRLPGLTLWRSFGAHV